MEKLKNLIAAVLPVFCVVILSSTADAQLYGGRGVGVSASITNGGPASTFVFADTGQLPFAGGNISISAPSSSIAGTMTTGVLTASTSGALRSSQSVTVANDVDINIGGVRVRANRVTVNAGCICCPGVETGICSASTTFNNLTVTDQQGNQSTVSVTGGANQVVTLPNGVGTLTLNEQVTGEGTITVNGLRVEASSNGTVYSILVASAAASIECARTLPTPADVTISGRVLTRSGAAVSRAKVTLTDSSGNVRTAYTNTLGYYQFDSVEAGGSYVLQAFHRSYSFNSVVVNAEEDATVDLIAN